MKKLLLAIIMVATSVCANAQLLFEDDFNYSAGQLTSVTSGANVSGGNWVNVSNTGFPIQVSANGLSYNGYISGGSGGKISIASPTPGPTGGEDVRRAFTNQVQTSSTTIYAGALLKINNLTNLSSTNGDYFMHFTNVSGTGNGFHSRLYIRSNGIGFNLGLQASPNTTSPTLWDANTYNVSTTYLVVIGYEIVAGGLDTARFWINPALTGTTPPIPNVLAPCLSGSEPDGIDALGIRQGSNTPNAEIDAIRVGTSWSAGTLPVQFKSFTATKSNDVVYLKWSTASESNNKGFEVQRIINGAKYQTLGFVKGNGNSNVVKTYNFTDAHGLTGNLCYRLKQIDFNGDSEFSKVTCVNIEAVKTTEVITTPNPFNASLNVKYNSLNEGSANMQIIDMLGKTHQNTNMIVNKGENTLTIDTEALPLGIYFIRITNGTEVTTQRIVKR
jgi:hypothetical protein